MSKAVLRLRRLACVLLMFLAATAVEGSTVIYRTDTELVTLSDRVIHGRVIRQRVERPDGPDGSIYTVTTLAVLEDFTGVSGRELEVWELGGVLGNEFMWIGGAVTYDLGAEVMVCLERGRLGLRSVAMGFSKFDVENGRLTRNTDGTNVVGGRAPLLAQELTLDEFRDLTARVRGVRPVRNADASLLQPEQGATVSFTFLTFQNGLGARWTEPDSGTPVNYYLNTSAPSPLLAGSGISELQTALQAWTAPATASIVLQYVGTTSQSAAKGPWSGVPNSGTVLVTFEDPNNEISGSTLAIGGGSGFLGGGGTVNGIDFNKWSRGYVIWQNAADLPASFRQSTNFARVMEHEIGHTIGLGHSGEGTGNIMHPSCCTDGSTPIAPALGPDDLAGLNFIYPSSTAPGCTYSISSSSATAAAAGGSGNVSVTAGTGCAWSSSVVTGATFLTRVSGASGSGNGTVNYTVAANSTTVQRTGTLSIAGNTFTVVQAAGCSYGLNATSTAASAGATTGAINVTTQAGCAWTATTNTLSMVTVTGGSSGTGNGTVTFSVAANVSASQRTGTLTIAGITFTIVQAASTFTAPNDLDGDAVADLTVWRPGDGTWFTLTSTTGYNYANYRANQWGNQGQGDIPLFGDIDGDALADLIVWRPTNGTWYWLTSSSGYNPVVAGSKQWGNLSLGDQPMVADMDGDRRMDLIVWRASTGTWHWLTSSSGYDYAAAGAKQWGNQGAGDVPKTGDVDGDGRADLIVWRAPSGTWFWLTSSTGYDYAAAGVKQWGNQSLGDTPLVADIDGDRRADLIVWRAPEGTWYWLTSASGYSYETYGAKQWGNQSQGDVPLTPDLDGDGKADLVVWRAPSGTWHWLTSRTGYNYANAGAKQWGSQANNDIPMSR